MLLIRALYCFLISYLCVKTLPPFLVFTEESLQHIFNFLTLCLNLSSFLIQDWLNQLKNEISAIEQNASPFLLKFMHMNLIMTKSLIINGLIYRTELQSSKLEKNFPLLMIAYGIKDTLLLIMQTAQSLLICIIKIVGSIFSDLFYPPASHYFMSKHNDTLIKDNKDEKQSKDPPKELKKDMSHELSQDLSDVKTTAVLSPLKNDENNPPLLKPDTSISRHFPEKSLTFPLKENHQSINLSSSSFCLQYTALLQNPVCRKNFPSKGLM